MATEWNNGDVVAVHWRGFCHGQRIILTSTWEVAGLPEPLNADDVLEKIVNAFAPGGAEDITTDYLEAMPTSYELTEIRAQRVYPERTAYYSEADEFPGVYDGDTEDTNVAAVITLRTQKSGRSQIATKHIGPIPTAARANGLVTDAYQTILTAIGTNLVSEYTIDGVTGLGLFPVIYHGELVLPTTDFLTNFFVQDTVRVMRRRTVRVGE